MKPSAFKSTFPWSSVIGDANSETIAVNIMKILSRTGDEWRELTWEEYRAEREMDGNFSSAEKPYFDEVIDYTISPQTAALLCQDWRKIAKGQ